MKDPILRAENLTVAFQGLKVADDVSLDVYSGEFMAIIGTNGSGKTTFLNTCTGYIHPKKGRIFLEDEEITGLTPRAITRRGIARAFQLPQLFMDRSVLENVLLSIAARHGVWEPLRSITRRSYKREAMEMLELVGLDGTAQQPAIQLPEGMRKLADIVLALALQPRLILLDEPTSSVSADEKFHLMETLMVALREHKVTALFVEHDMEIVRRYADRVAAWDSGRVTHQGTPDEVLSESAVLENVVGAS